MGDPHRLVMRVIMGLATHVMRHRPVSRHSNVAGAVNRIKNRFAIRPVVKCRELLIAKHDGQFLTGVLKTDGMTTVIRNLRRNAGGRHGADGHDAGRYQCAAGPHWSQDSGVQAKAPRVVTLKKKTPPPMSRRRPKRNLD